MTMPSPAEKSERAMGTGRDPDFIVIGAMKAGTTTLFAHLKDHPQVFMAEPKEPNYFSKDDVYTGKGRDWYRGLFANARANQRCGEASPSYTRAPRFADSAKRMAAAVPDAKLVYIMRHPVERFYSNYVFDRSFGFREPIRETLIERSYVLETSRYIEQVRRYLDYFPREQLHCLLLDDLRSDLEATLSRLAEFLGIEGFSGANRAGGVRANERGEQHSKRLGNQLLSTARRTPGMRFAKQLLPKSARVVARRLVTETLPQSAVANWLKGRHLDQVEPLTDDLRGELHELLDPSTVELEAFLGRDLSHWRRSTPAGVS